MRTVTKRLYEAMFLVDSAKAAADWDGIQKVIKNILGRADAEIVSLNKWDERKLAYEINHHSRGTYVLCYFKAETGRITNIERAVQLSDQILRAQILRADHVGPEDIDKETPAMLAHKSTQTTTVEAVEGAQEAQLQQEADTQDQTEPQEQDTKEQTDEKSETDEAKGAGNADDTF